MIYKELYKILLCCITLAVSVGLTAQISVPAGTTSLVVNTDFVAGDVVVDDGGIAGNYSNSWSSTTSFCPDNMNDQITLTVTLLAMENAFSTVWDAIGISGDAFGLDNIYHQGNPTGNVSTGNANPNLAGNGPLVNLTPPVTFTSVAGQCITLDVGTDGSVPAAGFEAVLDVIVNQPPGGGGGGAAIECLLVCSGDQTYTLDGGECTVMLPNLVTFAGPCEPAVTGQFVADFVDEFDFSSFTPIDVNVLINAMVPVGTPFTFNGLDCDDLSGIPSTVVMQNGGNCNGFAFTIYEFQVPNFNGTLSFDYDVVTDGFGTRGLYYIPASIGPAGANFGLIPIQTNTATGTFSINLTAGQTFVLVSGNQTLGGLGTTTITLTNLLYDGGFSLLPWTINQVSGPVAGENLSPGVYDLEFELIAPDGSVADECDFTVTVNGFANPSSSLSCNSQVNISVDNLCEVTFNADQFLEGDNYGCYDSLEIFILPFGNANARTGNVNGASVDFSSLLTGRTNPHQFEIRDPATGNVCWGNFIVEDKIAPAVDCPCSVADPFNDIPGAPATSFSGVIDNTDMQMARPNGFAQGGICTFFAPADHFYDAVTFQVTAAGTYTFNGNPSTGDTYGAIYDGPINNDDGCENAIAANDDTAGGLDPLITVNLVPGVTYTYVATTFGGNNQSGAWTVNISSPDGSVLLPALECQFLCYDKDAILDGLVQAAAPDLANGDNCGAVSGTFSDQVIGDECDGERIIRTWAFSDESGNTSTCSQVFIINSIGFGDLSLPPAVVELDGCGAGGLTPADIATLLDVDSRRTSSLADDDYTETPGVIELNEGIAFAYPHYFVVGFDGNPHAQPVDNSVCGIYATYTDKEFDACGAGCFGNKKIVRDWTLLDWCAGTTVPYQQIIKAVDTEAPTFITKDTTVSTRPWDCTAQFVLPAPWELHDNCDFDPSWFVTGPAGVSITGNSTDGYVVTGAPKGVHTFTYTAEDCCGNVATRTATITVRDVVAPVASTKQDIVVALTPGGPNFVSSAKVFVPQVNNFSYDACTDVYIELRRASGSPDCDNLGIDGYNNNVTFNNAVPTLHSDDNRNDTDNGQFVKVCCEDVTTAVVDVNGDGTNDPGYIEVIMRVWDDANMSGVFGDVDQTGHADNYNEAWAYVKVEDNLPPVIACPADVTIECYWAIDLSSDFGAGFQDASQANFDKTGVATAISTCDIEDVEFSDRLSLDDCGIGTITRTFRATKNDKNGNPVTSQCRQIITVSDDYVSTFMVTPPNPRVTTVSTCGLMQSDLDSNKPTVVGGICDVIGENVKVDTFLFEGGVCKKWVAEYNYTNWCTGEDMGPFFAEFIYEDTEAPIIECVDTCLGVDANCSYTYVFNKSAIDTSGCVQTGWLKWFVTFDAWADGTVDYAVSSFAPANYTTWRVDEALSAQYNVPLTTLWLHTPGTASGEAFTQRNGQPVSIPEDLGGQMSNHKVTYKVTDGCHNFASCTEDVMIADKKAPTPYCVSLSTALMAPNAQGIEMVLLWACDFNVGAFDNCSAQENLYFTFDEIPFVVDTLIRVGQVFLQVDATVGHYFNENGFVDFDGDGGLYPLAKAATIARYERGEIQRWLPESNCSGKAFTGADAPQANVIVSVWDQKLNTDFCEVFLTLRSSLNGGGNGTRAVLGKVETEAGVAVEAVEVTVDAPGVEQELSTTTSTGGFNVLFDDVTATVAAKRDGDDDNGLSTLDIVLIQRHILNIAPFSSPYAVFAADVNGTRSVSGADVVELRKLILGVDSEFANTDSWRFIDAKQALTPQTAFNAREMAISVEGSTEAVNMVGVKMGDVNGSVDATEVRSGKSVAVSFDDAVVEAGDVAEVTLSTDTYTDAYGFQFTLDVSGLEIIDVVGADLDFNDANVAILDANTATVSYASANAETASDMITLVVRATTAGNLSSMISINSDVTRAEAYLGENFAIANVELVARGAAAYELFQNEPNPFQAVTMIGWNMAEAGAATLTVFDIAGRVLKSITSDCTAGYNSIDMTSDELGTTGVLYYQIEAGDFTATKKMILID